MSVPTTLPPLDATYRVTKDDIAAYARDGHTCIRGLCSPAEAAAYRPVLGRVVKAARATLPPLQQRDTYGKAFIQIGNLWERDAACRRFSLATRFARVAAALMGTKGVRMYHDQALYKEAHGGFTPWHQDQFYWPLASDQCITMWMPLVDVSEDMGVMHFASGSHREGYLGDRPISDDSETFFKAYVKEKGYTITCPGAMTAGDATFHAGWTLHSAPGNNTDTMREVMTIIYIADDMRVGTPQNRSQANDLKAWFPGLAPGDLAVTAKNPLLWPDM